MRQLDLAAAAAFMITHARLLDRRRFAVLVGTAEPADLFAPLTAYRNADGGYGWGLEPDLRVADSQPVGAMHALEVLAEAAPATTEDAVALCGWLQANSLPDGGLPFVLPVADPTGCAPHWAHGDATTSSLQMTTQVAANAHLLGRHQPAVAAHPWLVNATRYCVEAIAGLEQAPQAYELSFVLRFLDAVAADLPEAADLLRQVGRFIPADGSVAVQGGAEGETLHPLDLAPFAGGPARALFSDQVIATDLERLAARQQDDGGWPVDFDSASPAAALEWRGYATEQAVRILLSS
jgi:hypothetical protein